MSFKKGDKVIATQDAHHIIKDEIYVVADDQSSYSNNVSVINKTGSDAYYKDVIFKKVKSERDNVLTKKYFWWAFAHGLTAYISYITADAFGLFKIGDGVSMVKVWFFAFSITHFIVCIVYLKRLVEETSA